MESSPKRRRVQRSPSPAYKLDENDDDYVPYVPVAQRRQEKLAKLSARGTNAENRRKQQEIEEREDEMEAEERRKEKERRERTLLMEAQEVHSRKALDGAFNWRLIKTALISYQMPKRQPRKRFKRPMQRFSKLSRVVESSRPTWNWRKVSSTPSPSRQGACSKVTRLQHFSISV